MDWVLFFYFLGYLLTRLLLLFTAVNLLVCGNVLILVLTFWLLKKFRKSKIVWPEYKEAGRGERPITTKPTLAKVKFIDGETGEKEKWVLKKVWIRED